MAWAWTDLVPLLTAIIICGVGLYMKMHDNAIDRENEAEKEKYQGK